MTRRIGRSSYLLPPRNITIDSSRKGMCHIFRADFELFLECFLPDEDPFRALLALLFEYEAFSEFISANMIWNLPVPAFPEPGARLLCPERCPEEDENVAIIGRPEELLEIAVLAR